MESKSNIVVTFFKGLPGRIFFVSLDTYIQVGATLIGAAFLAGLYFVASGIIQGIWLDRSVTSLMVLSAVFIIARLLDFFRTVRLKSEARKLSHLTSIPRGQLDYAVGWQDGIAKMNISLRKISPFNFRFQEVYRRVNIKVEKINKSLGPTTDARKLKLAGKTASTILGYCEQIKAEVKNLKIAANAFNLDLNSYLECLTPDQGQQDLIQLIILKKELTSVVASLSESSAISKQYYLGITKMKNLAQALTHAQLKYAEAINDVNIIMSETIEFANLAIETIDQKLNPPTAGTAYLSN